MRLDNSNLIAFDTALGTAQATATYGNIIDLVKAGNSHPELYIMAQMREAATSAGSATVKFVVQMADDESFSENLTEIYDSGAIAVATLAAGYQIMQQRLPLPLRRFLRVRTTVATADLTGGKADIFLVDGVDFHGMEN